jgi:plasmid stabilization system protein ParE
MAKIKIIWSRQAKKKLYSFLESFIRKEKNKSNSKTLSDKIFKEVKLLRKNPAPGLKTNDESIFGFIVDSLIIYYEISERKIIIHSVYNREKHSNQ